ncbi:MAG: adenylate/guanylate cyclase domain-containing protein [Verrucomicrobiales bacterium]|nr:adenylate/guanylate cyclase domain-containing protein [Verrucomicrobiales bacterium]
MKAILTSVENGEVSDLQGVSFLGRSNECNVLVDDPKVSRRHAMIRQQDDGFWMFDLGSFNGSYLNGSRVTAAKLLKDGDILDIADHEFRFGQTGVVATEEVVSETDRSTVALIRSKSVVILVSDIQGFTALSEQLSPDDLAQVIGSWYADCELIMDKYGATVDKFIGDCVLAYWTEVNETTLTNSILAAKDLVDSCNKIYDQKKEVFDSAGKTFGVGVAVHTGRVAYGGMSSGEFTLVGDHVNLTFRIESLTREVGKEVLVSGDFVEAAPFMRDLAEDLGIQQVKGRVVPVEIWGVHTFPEPDQG